MALLRSFRSVSKVYVPLLGRMYATAALFAELLHQNRTFTTTNDLPISFVVVDVAVAWLSCEKVYDFYRCGRGRDGD